MDMGSAEITLAKKELYYLSKINNSNKNKMVHYTPLIWGEMNGRIGKTNFNSLSIILDSIYISFIIIGKHMHTF